MKKVAINKILSLSVLFTCLFLVANCFARQTTFSSPQYYKVILEGTASSKHYLLQKKDDPFEADFVKIDKQESNNYHIVKAFSSKNYNLLLVYNPNAEKDPRDEINSVFVNPKNSSEAFLLRIVGGTSNTGYPLKHYMFDSIRVHGNYELHEHFSFHKVHNNRFQAQQQEQGHNKVINFSLLPKNTLSAKNLTFYTVVNYYILLDAYRSDVSNKIIIKRQISNENDSYDLSIGDGRKFEQPQFSETPSQNCPSLISTEKGDKICFYPDFRSSQTFTFNNEAMTPIEKPDPAMLKNAGIRPDIERLISPFYPIANK